MRPTVVCHGLTRLVPCLLVVAALGCGLGDYEEKLTREQKRADELEKLTSEPLELPKDPSPDVFVLPPKSVSVRPGQKPHLDRFYQYTGGSDFANVYLGWAGKDKPEDFRSKVENAFGRGASVTIRTVPWDLDRDEVSLEAVKAEKNDRTYYIYLAAGNKVALIFEVRKSAKTPPDGVLQASLQASLNTLALGADAAAERKAARKRPSGPKK